MQIKAIDTIYNGYRFRSRLEARWAVFFNALGIDYEYEKEGFDLGEAGKYLPDFYLKGIGTRGNTGSDGIWAEIKPNEPTNIEQDKMSSLATMTHTNGVILVGNPQAQSEISDGHYEYAYQGIDDCVGISWDNSMTIFKCYNDKCGKIKIEFFEGSYMQCPYCGQKSDCWHPDLKKAEIKARQARFEYGENA